VLRSSIETRLHAGRPGVQFLAGALVDLFLFFTASSPALGPASVAEHSPPSSIEVRNAWSYTSNPAIRVHGVVRS